MHPKLRPWQINDLPALVRNANDADIAAYMTDTFPHPYSVESGELFLQRVIVEPPVKVMAIEIEAEAAGSIGIFPQQDIFRQNAELGYWLAKKYWGKGFMSAALKQIVDYGLDNFPEIQRIFARPFGSNIASQRVLEKAGFILEAKFNETIIKNGKMEDELVYAIRR